MAKYTIAGNALVITSAMKQTELETIKKYRPSALTLMGGKDNKEELFCVDVGASGNGGINAYGACFCGATHDDAKKACITVSLEHVTGDVKEYVADKYGEAFDYLSQLEAKLPDVLKEILEQKKKIMDSIAIA